MKYRVLWFFPEEPDRPMLLGHFPTKRAANAAIDDDVYERRKAGHTLNYQVDLVEEELTQAQIDEIFKKRKEKQL